jgi:ketosteroid isomerase-like protein
MDDNAVVTQALGEYYKAFSTLDPQAILPHYCEPSLVISPLGVIAMPTHAAMVAAFVPLMEDLRARGFGRSELTALRVERLSATATLASGIAVRYKTSGQELEQVGVTYLVHKADDRWKIARSQRFMMRTTGCEAADWRDSVLPRADDSMSAPTTMGNPSSGPSLSHSELPKSLTVLFEIRSRVVGFPPRIHRDARVRESGSRRFRAPSERRRPPSEPGKQGAAEAVQR